MAARARWSALLAAATLVPSSSALSPAGQPRTSRATNAARCRGGSTCSAARNAGSIVSRSTTTASGSCAPGDEDPGTLAGEFAGHRAADVAAPAVEHRGLAVEDSAAVHVGLRSVVLPMFCT
jgi:hypothetical protein